jgi:DNA-binding winged helix-turn-helix (wHTH) protein
MAETTMQFGEFRFVSATGELTRSGTPVAIEHQPALLLAHLVASRGRLVTREELAAAIWGPDTHVNYDAGLNYCVRQVRAALGDDAKAPRFIETVPRRGYRFIAAIHEPVSGRSRRRWIAAAAAAALLALITVVESRPNNHHDVAVTITRALHEVLF